MKIAGVLVLAGMSLAVFAPDAGATQRAVISELITATW